MKQIIHRPAASAMVNSLRAFGYSFDTALSDIIDNSIAAGATEISIFFTAKPEPYVAILDNGCGMDEDRLIEAMRHGGSGPNEGRQPQDLGRFGLGLKTASLSQCRRLTVVTIIAGQINSARWDLDVVEAENDWLLDILSELDILNLPLISELNSLGHGTLVIWSQFDRAIAGEALPEVALEKLVDKSRDHLALVFHRYLSGDDSEKPLRILINGLLVEPKDPFLRSNRRTETLPPERVLLDGATITIQPYILPHLSNITEKEMALAGGIDGLRRHQGFYVYRNRRLIKEGTWFRLLPLSELNKLARVQIDIPNSLDNVWSLDVKKASANPPEQVREVLRRIIDRISARSENVFRNRKRQAPSSVTHLWIRSKVRQGVIYSINRDHPCITSIRNALADAEKLELERSIKMLELALPADTIYADMASDRAIDRPLDEVEQQLMEQAQKWLLALGDEQSARNRLIAALPMLEPFSMFPILTRKIIMELGDA